MDVWDVMKSRESDAMHDVKKGGGMFPTEPETPSVQPKQGLQKKDVEVHRAGKVFRSTRWVKPGEAEDKVERDKLRVVAEGKVARDAAKQPADNRDAVQDDKKKWEADVANTIYKQLGGGAFKMMTGAKNFAVLGGGALAFGLPYNFAKNGINKIKISLMPTDTYKIEFFKIGRAPNFKQTVVAVDHDIYVDSLREVISHRTGLALKKPNIMMGHPAKGFEQETPPSQA